jgi:hypothetical protein
MGIGSDQRELLGDPANFAQFCRHGHNNALYDIR